MKTFTANVCKQVIERHLLSDLPSIFSSNVIATGSDEEFERIASEPPASIEKTMEKEALAKGLRVLWPYLP